jgi:hypothetical protein
MLSGNCSINYILHGYLSANRLQLLQLGVVDYIACRVKTALIPNALAISFATAGFVSAIATTSACEHSEPGLQYGPCQSFRHQLLQVLIFSFY